MISQNKRRGKGRPREIPEELLQHALVPWEKGRDLSARQKNNRVHAQRAILALMKNPKAEDSTIRPGFKWLYDEALQGQPRRYYKSTILEAIGRIGNDRMIRKVARDICKLKPKAKDAVVLIRQLRSGEVRTGDSKQLSQEIAATIRQYHIRYKTSKQQVNEALARNRLK